MSLGQEEGKGQQPAKFQRSFAVSLVAGGSMHLGTITGSKRPAAGEGTAERAVRCSADLPRATSGRQSPFLHGTLRWGKC